MELPALLSGTATLPPPELMRLLFSYPYCNLIPQYFERTRDFENGLRFVECCSALLLSSGGTIPEREAVRIRGQLCTLELSMLDHLNRWEEYLSRFEELLVCEELLCTYAPRCAPDRFGRYLLGRDASGALLVHQLYLQEPRRRLIERKLDRLAAGKQVEHLKCHQQERLTPDELSDRYEQLERIFSWMKRYVETEAT